MTRTDEGDPRFTSAIYRFEPAATSFAVAAELALPHGGTTAATALYWTVAGDESSFAPRYARIVGDLALGEIAHFSEGAVGPSPPECEAPPPCREDGGSECTYGGCEGDHDCSCEDGLSLCGELCFDTDLDRRHCGGCFAPCDAAETCVAGACEPR